MSRACDCFMAPDWDEVLDYLRKEGPVFHRDVDRAMWKISAEQVNERPVATVDSLEQQLELNLVLDSEYPH